MYPIVILSLLTLVPLSWAKSNITFLVHQINIKQSSWKAGPVSPDDDIKPKLGFLGIHPDPNYQLDVKKYKIGTERTTIPTTFDARERWPECKDVIGNIRNQGKCDSCWAFSAAAVMSDRLCIATNGETKFEFSPEDLVSCCGSLCGNGCEGGYSVSAWQYFIQTGIVSGGDYNTAKGCQPYTQDAYQNGTTPTCQNTCQNVKYSVSYKDDKRYGEDKIYTVPSDVEQIQKEIMTNGPVQVSYQVYDDFKYYKSGVYIRSSNISKGGHAVKIIGWGIEGEIPYWLVANSWGTDWADYGGFFKIRRGTDECEIESYVIGGTPYTGQGQPTTSTTSVPGSATKIAGQGGLTVILALIYFYFARF